MKGDAMGNPNWAVEGEEISIRLYDPVNHGVIEEFDLGFLSEEKIDDLVDELKFVKERYINKYRRI